VNDGAGAAVEVIRGLVEQQELRLAEQQPGETHARHLAVAQAAERPVRRDAADAHPLERARRALGQIPAPVEALDVRRGPLAELDAGVGGQLVGDAQRRRDGRHWIEGDRLRQVRDAARARHAAGARRPPAGQHVEQRRLADAVGADEPRTHHVERERQRLEHAPAVGQTAGKVHHTDVKVHG